MAAPLKIKNNAATSLAAGILNSDSSFNVVDATLLPAISGLDYFYATLQDATNPALREVIKVTSIVGNTLTVIRAQEGTVAIAFSLGSFCEQRLTAATLLEYILQTVPEVTLLGLGFTGATDADYYNGWDLQADGGVVTRIASGADVNFVGAGSTSVARSGNTITISSIDTNTDTDTWRPISTSISSTSATVSASSSAVKQAYDLAASKGTGDITSVAVTAGSGLTGGGSDSYGSVSLTVNLGTPASCSNTSSNSTTSTSHSHAITGFALTAHNHAGTYSLVSHSHAGVYALIGGSSGQNFLASTLTASLVTATTVNASDVRLKYVLGFYEGSSASSIKAHIYDMKDGSFSGQVGYLYHEVQHILPEAVVLGDKGFGAVNYTMVHTAKIAELEARVSQLMKLVERLL